MSRLALAGGLLAAAAVLLAIMFRYQYVVVAGPAPNARDYAAVDSRRVDRWTGTVQMWACRDVRTAEVANVPAPPKATEYGTQDPVDAVRATGQYFIALAQWRKAFPHVDPETLHVTKAVCGWAGVR